MKDIDKSILSEYIERMGYDFNVDSLMRFYERSVMKRRLPESVEELCSRYNKHWEEHKKAQIGFDFVAYADGSNDNNSPFRPAGAAYVVLDKKGDMLHEASKGFINRTNNQMELLAVISAVNWVPEKKSVIVFSDSQYAVKVLSGEWDASANLGYLDRYKQASKGKNVTLRWVMGHAGFYWNEYVDGMAEYQYEKMRDELMAKT